MSRCLAVALRAEITRIRSPRWVYTTTSNLPRKSEPSVLKRCSSLLVSSLVIARSSSNTPTASAKSIPCFLVFDAAFSESQSYSNITVVYARTYVRASGRLAYLLNEQSLERTNIVVRQVAHGDVEQPVRAPGACVETAAIVEPRGRVDTEHIERHAMASLAYEQVRPWLLSPVDDAASDQPERRTRKLRDGERER